MVEFASTGSKVHTWDSQVVWFDRICTIYLAMHHYAGRPLKLGARLKSTWQKSPVFYQQWTCSEYPTTSWVQLNRIGCCDQAQTHGQATFVTLINEYVQLNKLREFKYACDSHLYSQYSKKKLQRVINIWNRWLTRDSKDRFCDWQAKTQLRLFATLCYYVSGAEGACADTSWSATEFCD